jgi:pyrrolidone-carboxylate peptidase
MFFSSFALRSAIFAVSVLVMAAACSSETELVTSGLHTDLGLIGNDRALQRFEQYQTKDTDHCKIDDSDVPRVIVTGFGPFSGADYNISGQIVRQIFECSSSRPSDPCGTTLSSSRLNPDDFGGKALQRRLVIADSEVDVCLIELAVQWDVAAAIIFEEAQRFKPAVIVMTGLGANDQLRFETQAVNRTQTSLSGYEENGSFSGELNRPVSSAVVPEDDIDQIRDLTWSTQDISTDRLIGEIATGELGARSVVEGLASTSNTYICNNTSYVLAATSTAEPGTVSLFGGNLTIQRLKSRPKIGFLHYPDAAQSGPLNQTREAGRRLLGRVLELELKNLP